MREILDKTGRVSIMTSGGYDPIHGGHISCIQSARHKAFQQMSHGRALQINEFIVVVNGDRFLEQKKGRAFMPLRARCQVVSAIRGVDYVVPFIATNHNDMSVCEAIEIIKPTYFCKGGDRNLDNIPEVDVCKKIGTEIITGCGEDKYWSSSDFINKHNEWMLNGNS